MHNGNNDSCHSYQDSENADVRILRSRNSSGRLRTNPNSHYIKNLDIEGECELEAVSFNPLLLGGTCVLVPIQYFYFSKFFTGEF